jgi:indolepyruvate ferredoxin oxidoreductase
MQSALIEHYENLVTQVLGALDHGNHVYAVELLDRPRTLRGFGLVKAARITAARKRQAELMSAFLDPPDREVA